MLIQIDQATTFRYSVLKSIIKMFNQALQKETSRWKIQSIKIQSVSQCFSNWHLEMTLAECLSSNFWVQCFLHVFSQKFLT